MTDLFVFLYLFLLFALSIHGLHILWLIGNRLLYPSIPDPEPASPDDPSLPKVTVQLPLYNEKAVAKRLIQSVCAMNYPKDILEIQVLDDSTDETRELTQELCEGFSREGFDIKRFEREERTDFKAGALQSALEVAKGDLIAIFDADFTPEPDFLLRTIPCFEDDRVGMTQVRWGHLNEDRSILTRLQALFLDGHFVMESETRDRAGLFLTFNGTAGVWRKRCIEDAGGWSGDTLTEDLDLSYRAQLIGWKFRFLKGPAAPGELPDRMEAFKSQQARWTRGAVETLRKLGPDFLRGELPWRIKTEAFFHLTSHLVFPALVLLSVCAYPALAIRMEGSWWKLLLVDAPLYILGIFSVNLFYVWGQWSLYPNRWERILRIPGLLFLGTGLAVSNTIAVLEGYFGERGTFERTPKSGGEKRSPYRLAPGRSVWIELALAAYLLGCMAQAVNRELWASIPFMAVFAIGFGMTGLMSLAERFSDSRFWGVGLASSLHDRKIEA